MRVPLGVVAIIYENRPNVTSDAAGLCLKSGNAAFLRGSSGAITLEHRHRRGAPRGRSPRPGCPADALVLVEDTSREAAVEFMQPARARSTASSRGAGRRSSRSILENATVPYVIDGDGNCHVYVDASADLDMALDIVVNAKTQRPSVCNAAESLSCTHDVADAFLPAAGRRRSTASSCVGDERDPGACVPGAGRGRPTTTAPPSSSTSSCRSRVVDSLDAAIDHVNRYGTGHTEAIVTARPRAPPTASPTRSTPPPCVVNASTRFVDGEEFGFGAEIGISTQKLHARGPMGLRELTTAKYVVQGDGQIRT